jgi:hypothetical protein
MLDFVEPFVFRGVHVDQALVSLCSIFGAFLACSVSMSGSKPKLKVRTLDEMFKKISSTH